MTRHTALAAMLVEQAKSRALRRHAEATKRPAVALGLREVALAEQLSETTASATVRALVDEYPCEDCRRPWRECVCPGEPELGCECHDHGVNHAQCTCEPVESDPPDAVDFSTCNYRWRCR